MQNVSTPRYETVTLHKDKNRIVQSVVYPIIVFFLSIASINIFQNFGKILMAPMIGGMWGFGAFVAYYLPSMRKEVINQTLISVASYCGILLGIRMIVGMVSGVTGEMFAATFDQPLPTVTANTIPGYLENALYASAALFPIAFFTLQARRLFQFRKQQNKMKELQRLRGYRE